MLNNIKLLFLSIFVFFIALFFILSSGIYVEKFSFAGFNVSQLYIKLDKKLIVKIEDIKIPTFEKVETNPNRANTYIQYVPWFFKIFERIDIGSLKIKDNEFSVTIDKSIFYIDNKYINISARPIIEGNTVTLRLYSLYSKDYKLLFNGDLKTDLSTNDIFFDGKLTYKEMEIDLHTKTNKDKIDFTLTALKPFSSIKFVKDFVKLHPVIEEWMYDNVTGKITLKHLKGQLDKKTFTPILSSLNGVATIENANVTYHKDLDTVKTPLLTVTFKDDNLYFNLEKPTYKDIKIDGSNVVIYGLSSKETASNIIIDIRTKHNLDQDVLDILKAFEVTLPVRQLDGTTDSKLSIQIYFEDNKLLTKGIFKTKGSNFTLNGFDFFAKDATVILTDSIVKIKDSLVVREDFFDAKLNLDIDTKKQIAFGETYINELSVQSGDFELIKMNDFISNIEISYANFVRIVFPELYTTISVLQNNTQIDVKSLYFTNSYSKFLQDINIYDGDLKIDFYNQDKINFSANLKNLNFPIYTKDGKKLNNLTVHGEVNGENIDVFSDDEKVIVDINPNENVLVLKDLDVSKTSEGLTQKNSNSLKLLIKGINSNILLNDTQKIIATSFDLLIHGDILKLDLIHNNSNLSYHQNEKDELTVKADNLSDTFINNLLGIEDIFQDGTFSLNVTGTSSLLDGKLNIVNTKVEHLAAVNNLITFINTTPAIINPLLAIPSVVGMATNGGFNLNGYRIVEGSLDFAYDLSQELFYIKELNTIGNMADFKATGMIDLAKKELDSDVSVIFLKDYSEIIEFIPIVNYLILGDDDSVSTEVRIFGDLYDPKIETNLAADAASGTFDFIKRIFYLPIKGIEMLIPDDSKE